MLDFTWTGV